MTLTNQDRASAGLNALVNDPYLHSKAEWRSQDMGDRDYFSHQIPPDNNTVFYYMQKDGYCFKVAGENIGLSTYGDSDATTSIEAAFMGSPSHRANILGTWASIGVGAYKAADGRKLYTVLFSIPCGASVSTPAPIKTTAPVVTPAPTQPPAPAATVKPTPKPTVKAISPTPTPTPTPAPTASPTVEPTASPTIAPIATPTPAATPTPTTATAPLPAAQAQNGTGPTVSLRVREQPTSQGPLDSLFHWLFGGLFGW
jgi:hypothetical protein